MKRNRRIAWAINLMMVTLFAVSLGQSLGNLFTAQDIPDGLWHLMFSSIFAVCLYVNIMPDNRAG